MGDKVTVSYVISDFTVGQDGYLFLWLDNPLQDASTAARIASQFDYTLADLSPGIHKLTLEAVQKNNSVFNPPVKQSVSFTSQLPEIPTNNISSAPANIVSFADSINWQYVLLVIAVLIIIIGLIVKIKWGRAKFWQ